MVLISRSRLSQSQRTEQPLGGTRVQRDWTSRSPTLIAGYVTGYDPDTDVFELNTSDGRP